MTRLIRNRLSPPPKALMDAIAKLGEEGARAGVLVETGGLFPTAMGARVRLAGGKLTTTDGPFSEAKERLTPPRRPATPLPDSHASCSPDDPLDQIRAHGRCEQRRKGM